MKDNALNLKQNCQFTC